MSRHWLDYGSSSRWVLVWMSAFSGDKVTDWLSFQSVPAAWATKDKYANNCFEITFAGCRCLRASDAEISVHWIISVKQMVHLTDALVRDVQIPCGRVNCIFNVIFVEILRAGAWKQSVDVLSLAEDLKWRFVLRKWTNHPCRIQRAQNTAGATRSSGPKRLRKDKWETLHSYALFFFFKKTGTGKYLSGVGVGRRYTCFPSNLALFFFLDLS